MKCTFFQLRFSWVATAKKKFQQLLPMIVTFFIWKNENRSLKCSREKKNNRRNNGDGKNILSMIIVFYTFEHWISTYNSRVHNVWLSSHIIGRIIQGLCWLETGFLFHKINIYLHKILGSWTVRRFLLTKKAALTMSALFAKISK